MISAGVAENPWFYYIKEQVLCHMLHALLTYLSRLSFSRRYTQDLWRYVQAHD